MDNVDLHNTEVRLNPMGHKERVKKEKGKREEGTLNELVAELDALLEYEGLEFDESVEFSGPLPSGGGAGSPDQLQYDRRHNYLDSDMERENGDTLTDMANSTRRESDGPEMSRSKSNYRASPKGNDNRDKYITDYDGDGLDNGVTHNESFTGTGAIAIPPSVVTVKDDDEENDTEDNETSESVMSRRNIINEWDPSFKGGNYDPGNYQMPSPTGQGVAKRNVKKDTVGHYDTNTKNNGKEWPRAHNDTAAMCDVDEDGVEHEPQGSHESSVGKPEDGHQSEVGHNWPNQPKHSGGGVAEPVEGTRYSDGGVLQGGSGQNDGGISNKHKMPSSGPITGTSGPQNGQVSEQWTPSGIGSLMEGENIDVQGLFDSYARTNECVTFDGFLDLCEAHGAEVSLDESSFNSLLSANSEYLFEGYEDAEGSFWLSTPLNEEDCDDEEMEMDDMDEDAMEEGTRAKRRPFSEAQVRSPEEESFRYDAEPEGSNEWDQAAAASSIDYSGDPDKGGMGYDDSLAAKSSMDKMSGPGHYGDHNSATSSCPDCGYSSPGGEESCPECGAMITGMEMDFPVADQELETADEYMDHGSDDYMDDEDEEDYDFDSFGSELGSELGAELVTGPSGRSGGFAFESKIKGLKHFMESAVGIIKRLSGNRIARALNEAWGKNVGSINPKFVKPEIRRTVAKMAHTYKGFVPVTESSAMDGNGGTGLEKKSKTKRPDLADHDTDMKEMGEPLGKSQTNTYTKTPVVKGTAKGMSESVKRNVARLAGAVQGPINESFKGLKGYRTIFTILVAEGKQKTRTPKRASLAESLADLEEILQIHNHRNVVLESFAVKGSKILKKSVVPVPAIKARGPLVSEGKAIFRFDRTAEGFADRLVAEGVPCKISRHNWGTAVDAKVNYRKAIQAFSSLMG
jgi:hypothetical protein